MSPVQMTDAAPTSTEPPTKKDVPYTPNSVATSLQCFEMPRAGIAITEEAFPVFPSGFWKTDREIRLYPGDSSCGMLAVPITASPGIWRWVGGTHNSKIPFPFSLCWILGWDMAERRGFPLDEIDRLVRDLVERRWARLWPPQQGIHESVLNALQRRYLSDAAFYVQQAIENNSLKLFIVDVVLRFYNTWTISWKPLWAVRSQIDSDLAVIVSWLHNAYTSAKWVDPEVSWNMMVACSWANWHALMLPLRARLEAIRDRLDEHAVGNALLGVPDEEESSDSEGGPGTATDEADEDSDDEDDGSMDEDDDQDETTSELAAYDNRSLEGMPGYGVLPSMTEETRREIIEYARRVNNLSYP
ncbi:hypothetical protein CC1G_09558 [Coprinopsis cinerea okayama7|uniref:Uncharacterized protein n=1 Tax=Coprinopsis cinerea (strain Okayama-7 / 130 / ATCC MYA-4618 / FGSC 9003) TaxID=240176 RepID=A8P958_COPC7|nr:hypothetical protein CC1G_09558 [Coprinopsis cinerea okayama7\|eukprot:XP_001839703.2 hypothetical protein CC1G_09558 [Coprinopsis cinerea okayama7\